MLKHALCTHYSVILCSVCFPTNHTGYIHAHVLFTWAGLKDRQFHVQNYSAEPSQAQHDTQSDRQPRRFISPYKVLDTHSPPRSYSILANQYHADCKLTCSLPVSEHTSEWLFHGTERNYGLNTERNWSKMRKRNMEGGAVPYGTPSVTGLFRARIRHIQGRNKTGLFRAGIRPRNKSYSGPK